jgi:hypothetical protein
LSRNFDTKLFFVLALAFVVATVIGTLSHEAGHAIVGKSMGYQTRIHYAYTTADDDPLDDSVYAIWLRNRKQVDEGLPFPEKERFQSLSRIAWNDGLWFTIGGPAETMLVGIMGLLLLFVTKKSFQRRNQLTIGQWVLVFMALFWLRQTVNLLMWLVNYLITQKFSQRGDEISLAVRLGLPFWLLAVITALIGAAVLLIVLFKFIPLSQRLTFIVAGVVGGSAGYVIWLHWLGPILLP